MLNRLNLDNFNFFNFFGLIAFLFITLGLIRTYFDIQDMDENFFDNITPREITYEESDFLYYGDGNYYYYSGLHLNDADYQLGHSYNKSNEGENKKGNELINSDCIVMQLRENLYEAYEGKGEKELEVMMRDSLRIRFLKSVLSESTIVTKVGYYGKNPVSQILVMIMNQSMIDCHQNK
jgi:hypothetical protein